MHAVMEPETTADTNWTALAACKGADQRRFYPDRPGIAAVATIREFCLGCPVKAECGQEASSPGRREHGVWGGELHVPSGVWTLAQLEDRYGRQAAAEQPRLDRGVCRWCSVPRSVRTDGAVRTHWVPSGGGRRVRCPGSGYAPQEAS